MEDSFPNARHQTAAGHQTSRGHVSCHNPIQLVMAQHALGVGFKGAALFALAKVTSPHIHDLLWLDVAHADRGRGLEGAARVLPGTCCTARAGCGHERAQGSFSA